MGALEEGRCDDDGFISKPTEGEIPRERERKREKGNEKEKEKE